MSNVKISEELFNLTVKSIDAMKNEEFDTMEHDLKRMNLLIHNEPKNHHGLIEIESHIWSNILSAVNFANEEDTAAACCSMENIKNYSVFKKEKIA